MVTVVAGAAALLLVVSSLALPQEVARATMRTSTAIKTLSDEGAA